MGPNSADSSIDENVQMRVVDTTGAGDALAAGFLLGGSLEEAARRGLECAARCVARVGSLP
jgi:sugar/nucleoside kinase (ribokinase family)